MLRRLVLRDVAIVDALELDLRAGFTVLTGETGAGKSILIDALQLALGSRGDATVVREGATRADISAEFDIPAVLRSWLDTAGFDGADTLLLRRTVDTAGKSRAWVNGTPATVTQLREAAGHLLDIHGQHAWQRLTQPASARDLLDAQAGIDTTALRAAFDAWKTATTALQQAQRRLGDIDRDRERLQWLVAEGERLAPGPGEWEALNDEHRRLAHAQALIDATRAAVEALADGDANAGALVSRALDGLTDVAAYDARLKPVIDVLMEAQAQLQDAAHSLGGYLNHADLDPQRLAELDARLSAWLGFARRHRLPPADVPALLAQWQAQLKALDDAGNVDALQQAVDRAEAAWQAQARRVGQLRQAAAPALGTAVTQAMQQLGMGGGRFEVALRAVEGPQPHGAEAVDFLVAGHAGSTPRPLGKVASGGELSRLALAIAVTTAAADRDGAATLIFDEIDAGIGGAVADTVGRLMKALGSSRQVLAVTHLAQVAACADQHVVVSKSLRQGQTLSDLRPVEGTERVAEVARMLGGDKLVDTSMAHARALLGAPEA